MNKTKTRTLSVNDEVIVKLTKRGIEVLKDYYYELELNSNKSIEEVLKSLYGKKLFEDYMLKIQLWKLMVIYGDEMYMGNLNPPFENLNIYINMDCLKRID